MFCIYALSDLHFATVYGLRIDLGGCKIRGGRMPPDSPISFCTSRGSLPMQCPSNGDVLATPLPLKDWTLRKESWIRCYCICYCWADAYYWTKGMIMMCLEAPTYVSLLFNFTDN